MTRRILAKFFRIYELYPSTAWVDINERCRLWDELLAQHRNSPIELHKFMQRNKNLLLGYDDLEDDLHLRAIVRGFPSFRGLHERA